MVARTELRSQPADGAQRQHAVAARLAERAHIGDVVDPVRQHVGRHLTVAL